MSRSGILLGTLGVAAFGLTLPFTRIAVQASSATETVLVRLLIAGCLALPVCLLTRSRLPRGRDLLDLFGVVAGVVIGFPLFTSLAMRTDAAAHGGVILGILPLATAVAGTLLNGERPSPGFWLGALAGTALVLVFAVLSSTPGAAAGLSAGDGWLLAAIVSAAVGYTLGGRLSRRRPAWQVISLALALATPLILVACALAGIGPGRVIGLLSAREVPLSATLSLLYLGLISQYGGFLLWYRAIAIDGVARTSQLQLLQPFFTLAGAWYLVGERIDASTVGFTLAIIGCVLVSRRLSVRVPGAAPPTGTASTLLPETPPR